MSVYQYDSYLMKIPFLISSNITEYDISKANISILLAKGHIDLEQYNGFLELEKSERERYVGLFQKTYPEAKEDLNNGFVEYRKRFIEANNLNDSDILAIHKDSLHIINKFPSILTFDKYVTFSKKVTYTSFFKILNLELYYMLDNINNLELLDVKGINDSKLILHQDYMMQFLCIIFEAIQSRAPENVLDMIVKFSDNYKNMSLDLGYYREFNPNSCFRISAKGTQYLMDDISEKERPYLNISYNYKIIQELYKIVSNIYFGIRR